MTPPSDAAGLRAVPDQPPPDPDARPLALFDLDGTLTDPGDGIVSCHLWALDQLGYSPPDGLHLNSLIGPPAEEAHAILGVPADRIDESTALYRERFALAGWLEDAPYPGVGALIEQLAGAGWQLGIATMKLEPFAERIVDRIGFRPFIDVVAGSDNARTRTSKRAVIERALTLLDHAPDGVAMVGDRRHDIDAARSMGMTAIGAAWGFGSIDELIGANAHAIAVTPADVADFLL